MQRALLHPSPQFIASASVAPAHTANNSAIMPRTSFTAG